MNAMDVEHHEELHRLALSVDNHESRIDDIETHWINYEVEIDRLDNKIDSSVSEMKGYLDNKIDASITELKVYVDNKIDSSIAEMKVYIDNKIDSSISGLQNKIDDVSTGLSNVTEIVNNLSQNIVLTQEEYDNLDYPDYNSFYFTYEDSSNNI